MTTLRRASRPVVGVVALSLVLVSLPPSTSGAELAGSQGTDTSLPATASATTLSGRGPFSDLKITLNQTKNLVNQAISVTWSGARPTISKSIVFSGNYLQIMQCWGDDDGSVPSNPGPPPQQCEFGAVGAVFGGTGGTTLPAGFASRRVLSSKSWPGYDPSQGVLDSRTNQVWMPFRGASGNVTDIQVDPTFDPAVVGGSYFLNPDFDAIKTNEIVGARTGPDGNGAELFQVNTGAEAGGLGCGQAGAPVAGGGFGVPKCWLVVVPRGTPAEEDVGVPQDDPFFTDNVYTSPLAPSAWKNRIAFPLEFNPLSSPCAAAADQRQLSGNELAAAAMASWQPALCATGARRSYSYSVVNDATARIQLQRNTAGGAGMIMVNKPFDPTAFASTNPVVYSPVAVSATVVGFNVERNPNLDADAASKALAGVRVAQMKLTPRLIAKLLTQSYVGAVEIENHLPAGYTWAVKNPAQMGQDPDFLQFNPEFTTLTVTQAKNFGSLVLPLGNSDQAEQVWRYVLADPEAKAWLDGKPDPWGMRVNPVYATTAAANSNGAPFADPVPNSYPKSDPYCYQGPALGQNAAVVPPPICGNGWVPYALGLRAAARETRAAADGAKVILNVFATSPDEVWGPDVPQGLGSRAILAITDSPSAAQYGIQTASLSRAGDDAAGRQFVSPDNTSMAAAVAGMKSPTVPGVLEPNPSPSDANAYPLTAVTYAVTAPLQLDNQARQEYAAFVGYASGAGQTPGVEFGQLPIGYAPLADPLRKQAAASANLIRTLTAPPASARPSSSPTSRGTVARNQPSGAPVGAGPVGGAAAAPATAPATGPASPDTATTPTTRASKKPAVVLTPALAATGSRYFVPGLLAVCLLCALGALEITKRPRSEPPVENAGHGPGAFDDDAQQARKG